MRLYLTILRNSLPPVKSIWPIPEETPKYTVAELLENVNTTFPLEAEHWGLEDYIVTCNDFDCIHYHDIRSVCNDGDHLTIRPLQFTEVRARTVSGRTQISSGGRHLIDGVAFGRPVLRELSRPDVHIPPRKRRKLEIEEESAQSRNGLTSENVLQDVVLYAGGLSEDEDGVDDDVDDDDFVETDLESSSNSEEEDVDSADDSLRNEISSLSTSDDAAPSDTSEIDSDSELSWNGLEPDEESVTQLITINAADPDHNSQATSQGNRESITDLSGTDTSNQMIPKRESVGTPFEGTRSTKSRNLRRKQTKRLAALKKQGLLSEDASFHDLRTYDGIGDEGLDDTVVNDSIAEEESHMSALRSYDGTAEEEQARSHHRLTYGGMAQRASFSHNAQTSQIQSINMPSNSAMNAQTNHHYNMPHSHPYAAAVSRPLPTNLPYGPAPVTYPSGYSVPNYFSSAVSAAHYLPHAVASPAGDHTSSLSSRPSSNHSALGNLPPTRGTPRFSPNHIAPPFPPLRELGRWPPGHPLSSASSSSPSVESFHRRSASPFQPQQAMHNSHSALPSTSMGWRPSSHPPSSSPPPDDSNYLRDPSPFPPPDAMQKEGNLPARPTPPIDERRVTAAARHIWGALGHRAPKTNEEADQLRTRLSNQKRRSLKRSRDDAGLASTSVDDVDTAACAGTISNSAESKWNAKTSKFERSVVECCEDGPELSLPPYPFRQRWDWDHPGHNRKRSFRRSNGSRRKRQRKNDDQSGHDIGKQEENSGLLDYGEDDTQHHRDDVVVVAETGGLPGEDEFPELPSDLKSLPSFGPESAKAGIIVFYTELVCSAATGWMPETLVRTVRLIEHQDNDVWIVQRAQRDLAQKEYDADGERVYHKFEMEGYSDDEDSNDTYLIMALADMADAKILAEGYAAKQNQSHGCN